MVTEVPQLPTQLRVDGREVRTPAQCFPTISDGAARLILLYCATEQLFGQMMRTSTTVDPKMRTAIMRLKGEHHSKPRMRTVQEVLILMRRFRLTQEPDDSRWQL